MIISQSINIGVHASLNSISKDRVFIGRGGKPIKDVRSGFNAAVLKAWKPANKDEKRPRFHDLRKTGATRVEAVSSKAAAKAFLGHADQDVTDTYILPSLDDVRDAINRAAFLIDRTPNAWARPKFQPKTTRLTETQSQAAGE